MNRATIQSRIIRWAACAACFGPLATLAVAQVTPNRGAVAPNQGGRGPAAVVFTPEELATGIEFMKQHAPHRLIVLENRRAAARENFERTIINEKRRFDRLQPDAAIYDVRLREFEINDDIFEICRQMKQMPKRAASFEPQLKTKVADLFDVGMKERQIRIDRLEKALADQRKAFDGAQKNREDLIAKNVNEISKTGVQGALFNRPAAAGNPGEEVFSSPKENPPAEKKK